MKLSRSDIEKLIKMLLLKYNAEYAILFGSYARGDATEDSDIDVIVVGGANFRARDIFAFGEELRLLTQKDVDAFEIREVNKNTEFYNNVLREGVRIA
jgi:predicted nucleotidyltransferase